MARFSGVAKELLFITILCTVATVWAFMRAHENSFLLAVITSLMVVLMIIAQISHRRDIKTLQGRGKRKGRGNL